MDSVNDLTTDDIVQRIIENRSDTHTLPLSLSLPFPLVFYKDAMSNPPPPAPRLQFEARNQNKEAKEMAVIEAMRLREEGVQGGDATQAAQ